MARTSSLSKTCWLFLLLTSAALADDYADARSEMVAAYQSSDFAAMRSAAQKALAARPGYPGALFNLALAQALDDDPAASLDTLRDLLAVGVDFNVAEIPEFGELKNLLEWGDYAAGVERLNEPAGFAEVVARLDTADFVPEGIAADANGRFYLGSIRHGTLVRLGEEAEVLSTPDNGHWSVFGMRFDDRGDLWFASAAVPQFADVGDALGASGVFRLDTATGAVTEQCLLPPSDAKQVLGDLVLDRDGVLYTTDSLTGAVYRYRSGDNAFGVVAEPGVFGSPQGLVLDDSGEFLYVADYIGGLYRVRLSDGTVEKLAIVANVTDYGIDGLYRYGDELVAIQNGIRPHRVVALELGDDGRSIVSGRTLASNLAEFDEPTLGFVRDDDLFFVANSHWNRFDQENALPPDLSGPIILRISLKPQ